MGKTTCAAARAVGLAEAGSRILVASTDPAHSLGDALGLRLGPEPRAVPRISGWGGELLAVELDVPRALARFIADRRAALERLALDGTYLDDEDVARLLDLAPPGADELAGLLELRRVARAALCERVVVDTAPTGHTLRLLQGPAAVGRLAAALAELASRPRWIAERFGRGHRSGPGDALIAELEAEARELAALLRAGAFTWVLLPEALAIAEAEDGIAALDASGLDVSELVVNRVTTPEAASSCAVCRERRRAELAAIAATRAAFPGRPLRLLPARRREPRGLPSLRAMARALADPARGEHLGDLAHPADTPPRPRRQSTKHPPPRPPAWLDLVAPSGARLVLFGGKGGVGKTTSAAAAALTIARDRPEARVLLLSTDPAHSLGDVLETPLGDDERRLPEAPPNLVARELDPERALDRFRERHGEATSGALAALAGSSLGGGPAALLDLAPPGLPELAALDALTDAAEAGEGSLTVVDTAPTGHTLRLLELPDLALAWDHALLSVLLKYREVVPPGDLAAALVDLSKRIKRFRALLRDGSAARFIAVTRPGELPRRETRRLLAALARLGVAVPAVLANAVPPESCEHDGSRVRAVGGARGHCAMIVAPGRFPPPQGVGPLLDWARSWTTS